MHVTVPIRQNGRIVIPAAVREELNLTNGDLVELQIQDIADGDSE